MPIYNLIKLIYQVRQQFRQNKVRCEGLAGTRVQDKYPSTSGTCRVKWGRLPAGVVVRICTAESSVLAHPPQVPYVGQWGHCQWYFRLWVDFGLMRTWVIGLVRTWVCLLRKAMFFVLVKQVRCKIVRTSCKRGSLEMLSAMQLLCCSFMKYQWKVQKERIVLAFSSVYMLYRYRLIWIECKSNFA